MTSPQIENYPLRVDEDDPTRSGYLITLDGGAGVLVRDFTDRNSTELQVVDYGIHGYDHPPLPHENFRDWKRSSGAVTAVSSVRPGSEQSGLSVSSPTLEIFPPIQDPATLQRAAGILGVQFLRYQNDPCAPNTVVGDLVAAGVPFENASVTIRAMNYPA